MFLNEPCITRHNTGEEELCSSNVPFIIDPIPTEIIQFVAHALIVIGII
jgi:hypothetical protein